MRLSLAAAVSLGVLGAALSWTSNSFAYCRTTTCDEGDESCKKNERGCVSSGVLVTWGDQKTIPYRIYAGGSSKLDDDQMRDAVHQAFETWQTVDCGDGRTSLRFVEGEPIREDKPLGLTAEEAEKRGIEPFGIYFRDEKWDHSAANGDVLAATSLAYGVRKGLVSYADIEINTVEGELTFDDDQAPTAHDFQAILTHEIGHYIGLAHSKDADSIMAPVYCSSEARCNDDGVAGKRALADDDIRAVCTLYPHGKQTLVPDQPTDSPGLNGGTTAGCSATRGGGFGATFPAAGAGLVSLGAAFLRRRRRRPCL